MAVRILPAARARLVEIWEYTEQKWGDEQADKYVREMVAAIQNIAAESHRGKRVKYKGLQNVSCFRHRHHYVFFRVLERGDIGVISILHENMDLPSRLRDDSGLPD